MGDSRKREISTGSVCIYHDQAPEYSMTQSIRKDLKYLTTTMKFETKRKILVRKKKAKTCNIPFTKQSSSESPIQESNDSAMHRFSLNFDEKIRRLLS
jgi:hypothetical protein